MTSPRTTRPRLATSEDAGMLALDRQLCFALYSASLAMTKLYKPLLDPLGLTYPQYLVMLVLWEGDGMSVSTLGDRLRLDSGTLTPLLKRLEGAGLVARQRDRIDERRVLLRLTDQGRELRQLARCVPPQVVAATACGLDDLTDLAQQLTTLRDRLDKAVSPFA